MISGANGEERPAEESLQSGSAGQPLAFESQAGRAKFNQVFLCLSLSLSLTSSLWVKAKSMVISILARKDITVSVPLGAFLCCAKGKKVTLNFSLSLFRFNSR